MLHKKQRVYQHIMEDESYQIIKDLLPKEYVIREFNRPDYGIDLVIELFEKIDDEISETLGEFIYVQVKSTQSIVIKTEKVFPVQNVTKGNWQEDKFEYSEIDVAKYIFDTNSIYTIHSIGASVSVLLFLVDLETKNVYFICLNDFIDKVLLPQNPKYGEQNSVTVTIPLWNNLADATVSKKAMEFYGKRAKFLSAFSRFAYQKNELSYLLNFKDSGISTIRNQLNRDICTSYTEISRQVLYFIEQIEYLDIWNYQGWQVLPELKQEIVDLKKLIKQEGKDITLLIHVILPIWHKLANLNNIYEELAREWFLPKFLSLMTSYPKQPKILSSEA